MRRKIWIATYDNKPYQVDAEIVGHFGINGKHGAWIITHIETGCRVFDPIATKQEAIDVARKLSSIAEFGLQFSYSVAMTARDKTIKLFGRTEYDRLGGIVVNPSHAYFVSAMRHALVGGQPQ